MNIFKKILSLIFLGALVFAFWFAYNLFSNNTSSKDQSFAIEAGQGVNQISASLFDKGIIKNKFVFETWLWLKQQENKVVAGVYDLPKGISIYRLSNTITKLPLNSQRSVLLPEGLDRNGVAEILKNKGFDADKFLLISGDKGDWQTEFSFLNDAPRIATLEGYIFPDTYFVDKYTTVEDFIRKTLSNFDRKLNDKLRAEIATQNQTIFEVVTLASIIEREVPNDKDKKMIADIFLKRLKINMALQSDATVNFVTGKGLAQPTYEDLEINSPYNTYKNPGLPPGPISSPGISSIEAVLYPTANDYYYFLTDKEGKVYYAKTYEEHLANKAKYLD
jgi:UPF0755 protein